MLNGLCVAMITPFKNGSIDEEALRNHATWLIDEGVHGLVPCGTTGEGATLNPKEYSNVVRIVKETSAGRIPVIAGAGANATSKAIELAKIVTEAGADLLLQVTPYYNKPTQRGLIEHFTAIAKAVQTPIILYNVPGRTAVNMLPETVEELSKISTIVGVKEASGNLEQIEDIKRRVRDDFSILSGNDDQNLKIYERGGVGAISVTGNVAPAICANVWNNFNSGENKKAATLQEGLAKLNDAMFIETNPIPVKTSLSLMGRCNEEFRLPLTSMSIDNKKKLTDILKSYELIQ